MLRLLRGGRISHSLGGPDGAVSNTDFHALTLKSLGSLVRNHIVGEQESLRLEPSRSSVDVLPEPQVRARISESDVEDFLSKDAVLSSAWARFKGTHFTESNRFFTALADLPFDLQVGGGFLRKAINDAAIVRLLEVAGYIEFDGLPASGRSSATSFYETVPRGWIFPQLEFNGQWRCGKALVPKRSADGGPAQGGKKTRRR